MDAVKVFGKNHNLFIKNTQTPGMKETYLKEMRTILSKSTANNMLNGQKVKHFN